jgi:hypothetical protein
LVVVIHTDRFGVVRWSQPGAGADLEDLAEYPNNPFAMSKAEPGPVVLDLGHKSGFAALLAARELDETGGAFGEDQMLGMSDMARQNAPRM